MESTELAEFLTWDSNFFGVRIARVIQHRLNPNRVREILKWCEVHAIDCLYFLADSDHAETVRLAEDHGFRLVDIRVTMQSDTKDRQAICGYSPTEAVHVRQWRMSDIPSMQAIARASYGSSRFYFDPCFPSQSCQALYEMWTKRSCEGYADVVLVAELGGQLVGYISCHLVDDMSHGGIGLVARSRQTRASGVGYTLVTRSLDWFADHGVEMVSVVTQGRNIAAQRLFQRCGFLVHSVQLWYHRWSPDCVEESRS